MECPRCKVEMDRVLRRYRIRRGDRDITARGAALRCSNGCLNDTAKPFELVTLEMAKGNDALLEIVWLQKYKEPMPPRGRPGRPRKAERRTELLGVPLTPAESAELDKRRGTKNRASYTRVFLGLADD